MAEFADRIKVEAKYEDLHVLAHVTRDVLMKRIDELSSKDLRSHEARTKRDREIFSIRKAIGIAEDLHKQAAGQVIADPFQPLDHF